MPTPTKYDVMVEAKKHLAELNRELGYITPEEQELKESGLYEQAKRKLMATREGEREQKKYTHQLAEQVGLKVLEKGEWKGQQQKIRVSRWKARGFQHLAKPSLLATSVTPMSARAHLIQRGYLPKPKPLSKVMPQIKAKPKPLKKRQRIHTSRVGKTSRILNGHRFDLTTWKVKH